MGKLRSIGPRVASVAPRLALPPKRAEGFYLSPEWRRLVAALKAERGNWCERCGAGGRIIGDHKVERKDNGADLDPANIELLCQPCHNRKTAAARAVRAAKGG